MSPRKPDEFKKVLFDEPAHADAAEVLAARLQDAEINSMLAEQTSRFLADIYAEGLSFVRRVAGEATAKKSETDPAALAHDLRQSATFLELRSGEVLSFLERASALLDKKVEEDEELTEAFEKNVARYEKVGRVDGLGALVARLAGPGSEAAALHGSWALTNVYGGLVKLIGIMEIIRFERVSPTTLMDALSEILLDLNHRVRPGLNGEDGRTGLLELLSAGATNP